MLRIRQQQRRRPQIFCRGTQRKTNKRAKEIIQIRFGREQKLNKQQPREARRYTYQHTYFHFFIPLNYCIFFFRNIGGQLIISRQAAARTRPQPTNQDHVNGGHTSHRRTLTHQTLTQLHTLAICCAAYLCRLSPEDMYVPAISISIVRWTVSNSRGSRRALPYRISLLDRILLPHGVALTKPCRRDRAIAFGYARFVAPQARVCTNVCRVVQVVRGRVYAFFFVLVKIFTVDFSVKRAEIHR